MRRIRIKHTTAYRYQEEVTLLPHTLHLRPREGHDLRLESSRLDINLAFEIRWQRDVYGNSVAIVSFPKPATELIITSEVVVEHYEGSHWISSRPTAPNITCFITTQWNRSTSHPTSYRFFRRITGCCRIGLPVSSRPVAPWT